MLPGNRLWLLFAALVLTTLGTVGVAVVGLFATVSGLVAGGPILGTVTAWILGTLVLAGLDLLLGVALVSELASRAQFPTSRRAAAVCERVEAVVPPLAALGLSERFAPSVEDRRAALTERYVEGELSEAELEAELQSLLAESGEGESAATSGASAASTPADESADAATDREAEAETET